MYLPETTCLLKQGDQILDKTVVSAQFVLKSVTDTRRKVGLADFCGATLCLHCSAPRHRVGTVCLPHQLLCHVMASSPRVHFVVCQLSKRMGGVHGFCNIGLVVLQRKGSCIINKTEREQRKQEGDAQCSRGGVDVQSRKKQAGKLLHPPLPPICTHSDLSENCWNFTPWC